MLKCNWNIQNIIGIVIWKLQDHQGYSNLDRTYITSVHKPVTSAELEDITF